MAFLINVISLINCQNKCQKTDQQMSPVCFVLSNSLNVVSAVFYTIYITYLSLCAQVAESTSPEPFLFPFLHLFPTLSSHFLPFPFQPLCGWLMEVLDKSIGWLNAKAVTGGGGKGAVSPPLILRLKMFSI